MCVPTETADFFPCLQNIIYPKIPVMEKKGHFKEDDS